MFVKENPDRKKKKKTTCKGVALDSYIMWKLLSVEIFVPNCRLVVWAILVLKVSVRGGGRRGGRCGDRGVAGRMHTPCRSAEKAHN